MFGVRFHIHPLPDLPALDMKLRRLSKRILEGVAINNKSFRKTWESWLVFYYPDKALQIALSQGHTTTTQYEHYLNIPFERLKAAIAEVVQENLEIKKKIGERLRRRGQI